VYQRVVWILMTCRQRASGGRTKVTCARRIKKRWTCFKEICYITPPPGGGCVFFAECVKTNRLGFGKVVIVCHIAQSMFNVINQRWHPECISIETYIITRNFTTNIFKQAHKDIYEKFTANRGDVIPQRNQFCRSIIYVRLLLMYNIVVLCPCNKLSGSSWNVSIYVNGDDVIMLNS